MQLCELLKNPTAFDGHLIRLRGRLDFEFEGHTVNDEDCGLPLFDTDIWWEYGGGPVLASEPDAKRVRELAKPVLKDVYSQNSTNGQASTETCGLMGNGVTASESAPSTMSRRLLLDDSFPGSPCRGVKDWVASAT